jgi:hypothetical protein
MPATASDLHVSDAFDPSQNVSAGAKLLRMLLDKYKGDTRLALSAYNAGGGRVDQTGSVPDIQETQDYVASIMNRLSKDASTTAPISDPTAARPIAPPADMAKPVAAPAGAVNPANTASPPAPATGP